MGGNGDGNGHEVRMGMRVGMGEKCWGWAEETGTGLGSARPCVLTPATVPRGIPIEAGLALGAVGPRRVVEAAQAASRASVARLRIRHVDVIVALAGQAAPPGLQRVPVVPGRTLVAAGTCGQRALGSAWGWGRGHRACRGGHPPVYPGLQWQTTCRERPSW